MNLNGSTKRESMYYAWTPTYDRKLRLRRVLGKRFRVINGNHTVECTKCRGSGNNHGWPISGCSKCNGDGFEIVYRSKLKISRTLQFLYFDGDCDVDYTVFIFEDASIRWMEGKQYTQEFHDLQLVPEHRLLEFNSFDTLPSRASKEQLLSWR